ncbi:MAG: molybdenum cofactor biosynthesis protein MoaE [Bacteroidia bacterium]
MGLTHKDKDFEIYLKDGCIDTAEVSAHIKAGQTNYNTGAYNIFLGQVRQDNIAGKMVVQIEYATYPEMAMEALQTICRESLSSYNLTHITIVHSLGKITKGEICLMVVVSSKYRAACFDACQDIVERIKKEVPIWGKELFEDKTHSWKINKQ